MPPLIILGMHRSGTSLTVRLLETLGIHMGSHLSRDAEAVHFQKINRQIFNSVGSQWGEVNSLLEAMRSKQFVRAQTDVALEALFPTSHFFNRPTGIADFFGAQLWKALSAGNTIYWGWKDPRTTITFPIWLRVFPRARFLHVLRNGIDVAISTHRRSQKQHRKIWKRIFQLDYIPITLDFEYCYQLWEKYVQFVLETKTIIPSGQFLEIRFEDLLAKPEEKLRDISDFINYPVRDELLKAAGKQINKERLDNAEYARPYQDKISSLASKPLMQQLGYSYKVSR